jgi:hypothetical protein
MSAFVTAAAVVAEGSRIIVAAIKVNVGLGDEGARAFTLNVADAADRGQNK